jgi:acetylglutamate kinase
VTPLVIKFGGELLEAAEDRQRIARFLADAHRSRPLVVIHGGGRAVDAELARRRIEPRKVDGLRITDAGTLEAVVAVLAGSANTDLVAALVAAGLAAVGLTGVDAGFSRAARTSAHRTAAGETVDLGLVGDPTGVDVSLLDTLTSRGYVPVVASLSLEERATGPDGPRVLNVNADVMAARIAASLGPCDLAIAGGTAGVLDAEGGTIPRMDVEAIADLVRRGTATAGMIAKLSACRMALEAGVATVCIIDGRGLDRGRTIDAAPGTRLERAAAARGLSRPLPGGGMR